MPGIRPAHGAGGGAVEEFESQLQAIDLSDGTWSVYDPAGRLSAAASQIAGTHKNRVQLNFAAQSITLATSVTFYRKVRKVDGTTPSNVRRLTHRVSVAWAGRMVFSAGQQLVLMCGYANGIPGAATMVRLAGYVDGSATTQQVACQLNTVAGSFTIGSSGMNAGRVVHAALHGLNDANGFHTFPAVPTDGYGSTIATLPASFQFTHNTDAMGLLTDRYEWVTIGSNTAIGATEVYITGESGYPSAQDSGYFYTPEWGGDVDPLYCYWCGDSEWFGGLNGVGVNGANYPGVLRCFQEFSLRKAGLGKRRPTRWVAYTGSAMAATAHRFGIDGAIDTGAQAGRRASEEVLVIAARMTNLAAAGRSLLARKAGAPDRFYLELGINDIRNGEAIATARSNILAIASAVKAQFPLCEITYVIVPNFGFANYDTLVAGLQASAPNIDRFLDWSGWVTTAFYASVSDFHWSMVANSGNLSAFNGPFNMNRGGAAYSQDGVAAAAYHVFKDVYGVGPPLLAGEVAPVAA